MRFGAVSVSLLAMWLAGPAAAQDKIPNLASHDFAWLALGVDWLDPPPGLGHGPIRNDPAYPLHGNRDGPGQITPRIANIKDPALKPWAAKQMQEANEEILSGKRGLPFSAQSTCYPGGVPEQLLTPAEPVYFIQTPKEVWMVWESDHQVRRVYMTDKHSANVKPSWYGESIGHYEGDTLVVDTIGIDERTWVDGYGTPHTKQMHMVERFHLIENGDVLEVNVRVEDPGAFTTPWNASQRYRQYEAAVRQVPVENLAQLASGEEGPLIERACAENPSSFFSGEDNVPIPEATTPDF